MLTGGPGRDTLVGGPGDDILDGRRNRDTLITGDGNDTVVFSTPLGRNNVDTCFDFNSVNDTIQLSAAIFVNPALLLMTAAPARLVITARRLSPYRPGSH